MRHTEQPVEQVGNGSEVINRHGPTFVLLKDTTVTEYAIRDGAQRAFDVQGLREEETNAKGETAIAARAF